MRKIVGETLEAALASKLTDGPLIDKLAEALEKKIKEGGKEVDEVINRIDTKAPPVEEEELGEEEMPPLGDDAEE